MLIVAGLQVPVILLLEVVGSVGAVLFWQRGLIWVNVGVTRVFTTMLMVAGTAPWPAFGVNVYVTVPTLAVLIVAGFHVPVILLFDVVGKVGGALF